jgi:hypothetical protein
MVSTGDILGQTWVEMPLFMACSALQKPVDKFVGDLHLHWGRFHPVIRCDDWQGNHRFAGIRMVQRCSAGRVAGPGATPSTASGSPVPG